ncbi:conserved Plasmodium protein, unknown function [Plasmodium gallinaceum]|uniref:Uncharacterized protein n=1 Tax=Plasmodium gallinaceum TaxID=5849 RepID=A0A1J1GUU1_PLAGA|nr:conserved Plasmodium protein, unknown function [Plasmodium gallinaceum]CRG95072.1 conserved Plasmodium protein, unknown function [Plasmodium gallinaceum]
MDKFKESTDNEKNKTNEVKSLSKDFFNQEPKFLNEMKNEESSEKNALTIQNTASYSNEQKENIQNNFNFPKSNTEILKKIENNSNDKLKNNIEKSDLQKNHIGNSLENKFNFGSSLKIRKSLTEQLCEEISMKLGKIFLCKSYLETFIYEKNPYVMNFIYQRDDMSESKNRVLNSLLLSSFSNLVWSNNIYKHEYLLSKEILSKYIKALEKNPDKTNCCIIPIFSLDKIKEVLNDQEKNIRILKKKKLTIKKNNENLLFILNIIKNNFDEIKMKAQRIIQRLLFRLDILDKLFILKNNSVFFSNKYEYNKIKLIEILDFFNSFNIDNKLQKINKNITEIVKEKKNFQKFIYCDNEFSNSLKNNIAKNEQDIIELKSTTSEICINLEENKEHLYHLNHLNVFEGEENYEIL